MKRFDYEKILENNLRAYRRSIVFLVASSFVYVACFILAIFLSNYENRTLMMVVFSIILSLIGIEIVGIIIYGLLENRRKIKQINLIFSSYLEPLEGEIVEIKGLINSSIGRRGHEIIIKNDSLRSVLYDPSFGENPFRVGDKVKVEISESFIVKYEVENA